MSERTRFVGLDVHKASIAVAVAEAFGDPEDHGHIANDPSAVRRLMQRLGGPDLHLEVAYEAGPTGYALHRQLTAMGIACSVVAPSLIPVKPGDRIKTDRRDAAKLARLLRSGDLTPVWVPDEAHEALRDLVRARDDAKADLLRAKHRSSCCAANAAEDLGSAALDSILWAAIVAQELEKGSTYEAANAVWRDQVSGQCDTIKAGIRALREEADALP